MWLIAIRVHGLKPIQLKPTSLFLQPLLRSTYDPVVKILLLPVISETDILLFLLIQLISMASSDDIEGSLTPVDFIQLQHYMECKSPLLIGHYYNNYCCELKSCQYCMQNIQINWEGGFCSSGCPYCGDKHRDCYSSFVTVIVLLYSCRTATGPFNDCEFKCLLKGNMSLLIHPNNI